MTRDELLALADDCEAGTCGPGWPAKVADALRRLADLEDALADKDVWIKRRDEHVSWGWHDVKTVDGLLAWWRKRKEAGSERA